MKKLSILKFKLTFVLKFAHGFIKISIIISFRFDFVLSRISVDAFLAITQHKVVDVTNEWSKWKQDWVEQAKHSRLLQSCLSIRFHKRESYCMRVSNLLWSFDFQMWGMNEKEFELWNINKCIAQYESYIRRLTTNWISWKLLPAAHFCKCNRNTHCSHVKASIEIYSTKNKHIDCSPRE